MGTLLITGRNGQVGASVWKYFCANGWTCIEVAHTHNYRRYIIPELNSGERIVLIHSGQPKAPRSKAERLRYIRSTEQLFLDAKLKNIEIFFISSLSSHEGNCSHYSNDKKYLEKAARELGGSVLKLGLMESLDPKSPYKRIIRSYGFLKTIRLAGLIPVKTYYVSEIGGIEILCDLIIQSPQKSQSFHVKSSLLSDALVKRDIQISRELNPKVSASLKMPLMLLSLLGSGVADLALNLMSGMATESEVGGLN